MKRYIFVFFLLLSIVYINTFAQTPSYVGAYTAEDGSGIIITEDNKFYFVEKVDPLVLISSHNYSFGVGGFYWWEDDVMLYYFGDSGDGDGYCFPMPDGSTIYQVDWEMLGEDYNLADKNRLYSKCKRFTKDNDATSRMQELINAILEKKEQILAEEHKKVREFLFNNNGILGVWRTQDDDDPPYVYTITPDKFYVKSPDSESAYSCEPILTEDKETRSIGLYDIYGFDGFEIDLKRHLIFSVNSGYNLQKLSSMTAPEFNGGSNDFNGWVSSHIVLPPAVINTKDVLTDPDYGIQANTFCLVRNVEYYQWVEHSASVTRDKIGGGKELVTTYTYSKEWVKYPENSNKFRDPDYRDKNYTRIIIPEIEIHADNADFAGFILPSGWLSNLPVKTPLIVPPEIGNDLDVFVRDNTIYYGDDPKSPTVGDVRVTFLTADGKDISKLVETVKRVGIDCRMTAVLYFDEDGSVTNVEVKDERYMSQSLKEEVIRVIKRSPKWKPAMVGEYPVPTTYAVPIHLRYK